MRKATATVYHNDTWDGACSSGNSNAPEDAVELGAPDKCCICSMFHENPAPSEFVLDLPFDYGSTEPAYRSGYCADCFAAVVHEVDLKLSYNPETNGVTQ